MKVSTLIEPIFLQIHQHDAQALRDELQQGLLSSPASIPPKYFYDALGSRLFDAITALPEYYPTRTEAQIFHEHRQAITQALGPGADLIELGAGSCEKAASWFEALQPRSYLAIDISVEYLHQVLRALQQRHPDIAMTGVGLDFSAGLSLQGQWLERAAVLPRQRPVVMYFGSSIGNFPADSARAFLATIKTALPDSRLLIGVDLIKATDVLNAAYDDPLGVTAAFNRNVLRHVNQILGADFQVSDWDHVAGFDTEQQRIDMHLQARRAVTVSWPGAQRRFDVGDRIHTEHSCKYTVDGFRSVLHDAGYNDVQVWTDPQAWFALMLAG